MHNNWWFAKTFSAASLGTAQKHLPRLTAWASPRGQGNLPRPAGHAVKQEDRDVEVISESSPTGESGFEMCSPASSLQPGRSAFFRVSPRPFFFHLPQILASRRGRFPGLRGSRAFSRFRFAPGLSQLAHPFDGRKLIRAKTFGLAAGILVEDGAVTAEHAGGG